MRRHALAGALLLCLCLPVPALAAPPLPAETTPVAAPAVGTPVAATAVAKPAAAPSLRQDGSLSLTMAGRGSVARYSSFAVDRAGVRSPDAVEGASRVSLRMDLETHDRPGGLKLSARLAGEALHGTLFGGPKLAGDRLPGSGFDEVVPVEAWLAAAWDKSFGLRGGMMTSHWGLGLVANDGMAMFNERQYEWFQQPTVGDRVMRTVAWAMPWRNSTSALRGLWFAAAFDRVMRDDVANPDLGEEAQQGVLTTRMYLAEDRWLGLYYVYRSQDHDDGKFLRVHVVDVAADLHFGAPGRGLRIQAEGVAIMGTTSLSPSPEYSEHDVSQMGGAARVSYDTGSPGIRLALDLGWFSGDASFDDGSVNGFKADPNFQQGLVLFRRVLGWQTGRARLTASDPDVVGIPSEDLERLASGGSVTAAATIFPKLGIRFNDHLEVYGGLLFAIATAAPTDPFHTRTLGGGEARNFLGEVPDGRLLGTEVALGMRGRIPFESIHSSLAVGVEYGRLIVGDALFGLGADAPIHGGRLVSIFTPDTKEAKR